MNINQILTKDDLFKYQKLVKNVPVADNVIEYSVIFVNNTRYTSYKLLELGAVPLSSLYLIAAMNQ